MVDAWKLNRGKALAQKVLPDVRAFVFLKQRMLEFFPVGLAIALTTPRVEPRVCIPRQ